MVLRCHHGLRIGEMTPVSFMEEGLKRERHSCGIKNYRHTLEAAWSQEIIETTTPQFERLSVVLVRSLFSGLRYLQSNALFCKTSRDYKTEFQRERSRFSHCIFL